MNPATFSHTQRERGEGEGSGVKKVDWLGVEKWEEMEAHMLTYG